MNKPAIDDDPNAAFEADDDFMTAPVKPWDSAEDIVSPPVDESAVDPFAELESLRPPRRQILDEPGPDPLNDPLAMPGGPARLDPMNAEPAEQPANAPPPVVQAPGEIGDVMVPRIGIAFYCERPDTAETVEKVSVDRRLQRATTTIAPGGLSAAVEHFQNQPTPSLIVVESQDPPQVLIALLDQLAEVCDPGTKVVVIGKANDIALYRELMKRGVSEYLVAPVKPLQIIQAITTLYADPSAPFIGRSYAFVGAKGGVGASTLAHNFGYCLTEFLQTNAVIVDFDLPFGTAGLDFNQDPLQGVADALNQPDRLDPVLLDRMMARCTERLSLFAAPATLDDDYDISPEAFEEVATKIKTTAPYVVLDLPHQWNTWMRKVLLTSDEVVIVATPDLACLRNTKNMIDLIKAQRPNDAPPRLALNQVGVPGRPEIPVKDFAEAIGFAPSIIVPFDAKLFGNAANNGQMICEVQAKSKVAESLNQFVQQLSRREAPPAPARKSLLSGLLKGKA